uniref:Phospholipase B1, membrane-associated n=1 Tax=Anolis carolinensis TaxID=28377 RepID=G1KUV6_ANOCA
AVHTLRPSDIKAIAAIGSLGNVSTMTSVTSRQAQGPFVGLLSSLTILIYNLVSVFNPSVQYYSTLGSNKTVSRRGTINLLSQAKEIVKNMKESQWIDYQNDWKLITVFQPCPSHSSVSQVTSHFDNFKKLEGILDFLYKEVPKVFVNLVDSTLLTISSLPHTSLNHNSNFPSEICCYFNNFSRLDEAVWTWSYLDNLERLLASTNYELKNDFTVVLQTSLQENKIPMKITGKELAVTALGVGLWNNMMEPVGQKQPYRFTEMPEAQCPSQEHPYFFTYRNSNYSSFPMELQIEPRSQERSLGTAIPCSDRTPSDTIPASVHNLRPGDIKVISALGDSITAGNGAGSSRLNVIDVLTQYRGLSWSTGGNEDINTVTTLASKCLLLCISFFANCSICKSKAVYICYNADVSLQGFMDVPSQARRLIELMKNDPKINFQEDWKVITIFIGGNDLCDHCKDLVRYSPENFTSNTQTALDILHKEVPRAFVNLVTILHITVLRELYQEKKVYCPRLITRNLCSCVLNPADNSDEIDILESFNKRYQEQTHNLINSGRYDTREDFTVVVQPLFEEAEMPMTPEGLPDSSYFAPDCFHFQQKAHSQAARALWNNMLEPIGKKTKLRSFVTEINLVCPNQTQPYLMTYRNSNYTYQNEKTEDYGSQLLCDDRMPSINNPTSVHSLKPADVQVIAALGDSLTAGNGVGSKPNDILDMITQYRGLSWSIGGDASLQSVTTLPNILREFNTHLTGYSTNKGGPSDMNAFLNQAVPGAKAEDLPDQVKQLVKLMKSDLRIKFDTDWKVITVFIGVNDLCNYCKDMNHYSAANFSTHVKEALDLLHAEVPKVLVNLVEVMDPLPLRQLFLDSRLSCPTHLAEDLCSCVLPIRDGSSEMVMMKEAIKAYQSWFLCKMKNIYNGSPHNSRERCDILKVISHRGVRLHNKRGSRIWHQPFLGTYKNSNWTHSSPDPTNQPDKNWGSDLLCPRPAVSKNIPTSVHRLQPGDIQVVAALGDSLTSAIGVKATDLNDLHITWRGLSWR